MHQPRKRGGKKPPKAPTQETIPMTAPASRGLTVGMILKTEPEVAQMTRIVAAFRLLQGLSG